MARGWGDCGEINDSEREEFCGFCIDFEQMGFGVELRKAMELIGYVIATFGESTEEWEEAKLNSGEKGGWSVSKLH